MKYKFICESRWDDFHNWIAEKVNPFFRLYDWIVVSLQYAKFLWNNHYDWDYTYLLLLLRFKLKRMENAIQGGHHLNGPKYAKQIHLCCTLIDRLVEDDYCKLEQRDHDLKWGEWRWESNPVPNSIYCSLNTWRDNVKTEQDKEIEREEKQKIFDKQEYMRKQDSQCLFNTIAKYYNHWWD